MRSSGTTGAAKYIRVTHANFLAVAGKLQRWFDLSGADRSASMTPAYYAGGIKVNILSSLLLGGGVAIPSGPHPEKPRRVDIRSAPNVVLREPDPRPSHPRKSAIGTPWAAEHSLRFVAVSSGIAR